VKLRKVLLLLPFTLTIISCSTVHVTDGMYPPNEFVVSREDAVKMLGMSTRADKTQLKKATPFSTQVVVGRGERQLFANVNGEPILQEFDPPKPIGYGYNWNSVREVGLEILDLKFKSLDISANFSSNIDQYVTVDIEGIKGKVDIGRDLSLINENICKPEGGIGRKDPNAYVSGVYKLVGSMTIEIRDFDNQFGISAKLLKEAGTSRLQANGINLGINEQGSGKLEVELDTLWGIVHATEVRCDSLGAKML